MNSDFIVDGLYYFELDNCQLLERGFFLQWFYTSIGIGIDTGTGTGTGIVIVIVIVIVAVAVALWSWSCLLCPCPCPRPMVSHCWACSTLMVWYVDQWERKCCNKITIDSTRLTTSVGAEQVIAVN